MPCCIALSRVLALMLLQKLAPTEGERQGVAPRLISTGWQSVSLREMPVASLHGFLHCSCILVMPAKFLYRVW